MEDTICGACDMQGGEKFWHEKLRKWDHLKK